MIKFSYEIDNKKSVMEITESEGMTWMDLQEDFYLFLLSIGYMIDRKDFFVEDFLNVDSNETETDEKSYKDKKYNDNRR